MSEKGKKIEEKKIDSKVMVKRILALVLAIALALTMLLPMLPLLFAGETLPISDEQLELLKSLKFEPSTDSKAGELLYQNGFIKGSSSDGMELNKEDYLSRAEFAVIIFRLSYSPGENELMLQGEDASKLVALDVTDGGEPYSIAVLRDNTFIDLAAIPGWARPFALYCEARGYMVGDENSVFDSYSRITAQQLAMVLLRLLGYNLTWEQAGVAATLFGYQDPATEVTRGETFYFIWLALTQPIMPGGKVLAVELGRMTEEEVQEALQSAE